MAEYIFTEDDLDLSEESQSDELNAIQSSIASDAELDGELNVKNGMEIAGFVKGNIRSNSIVKVMETGRVEGKIDAYTVAIDGKAKLTLSARRQLEIGSSGEFVGTLDVQPEAIVISENAKFGRTKESADQFHQEFVINRESPSAKQSPKKKQ